MANKAIIRLTGGASAIGRGLLVSELSFAASMVKVIQDAPAAVFSHHGGVYMVDNSTPQNITTVPSAITGWTGSMPSVRGILVNAALGTLDPSISHTYQVSYHGIFLSSANNVYTFQPYVNGVAVPEVAMEIAAVAGILASSSFSVLVEAVAGSSLDLRASVVASNADMTLTNGQISVIEVL